jgi:uncharacterized protein
VKDLLTLLARGLVKDAHRVHVHERSVAPGEVAFELEVAPDDRGRVIGRGGRTVDAMRTLLLAVAKRRGETCSLEIAE